MKTLCKAIGLIAAAVVLAAGATSAARADFTITGPSSVTVGQNTTFGVTFTLDNTGSAVLTPDPSIITNPAYGLGSNNYLPVEVVTPLAPLPDLQPNAPVSYTFELKSLGLQNGETSHVVLFNIGPYYVDASGAKFQHETPDITITVSSVPEPSTLGLLACAGLVGLVLGRLRRPAA